MQPHLKLK